MSFQNSADALMNGINSIFGTTATYTYASDSTTQSLKGVFENGYLELNGVITKTPLFKNVKLSDLSAEPIDTDTLTIATVIYIVRGHEPDSTGSTTLILEKT